MESKILNKNGDPFLPKIPSSKLFHEHLGTINKWVSLASIVFLILTGINTLVKFNYYGINLTLFDYDVKSSFALYVKHIVTWVGALYFPTIIAKVMKNGPEVLKPLVQAISAFMYAVLVFIIHFACNTNS